MYAATCGMRQRARTFPGDGFIFKPPNKALEVWAGDRRPPQRRRHHVTDVTTAPVGAGLVVSHQRLAGQLSGTHTHSHVRMLFIKIY